MRKTIRITTIIEAIAFNCENNRSRSKSNNYSKDLFAASNLRLVEKKSSTSNSKSIYLYNTSIVAIIVRSKQFKLSNIKYFYPKLLKKS